MTSITAIFFDLDGTLVDSSIGIHNAFTHTFKAVSYTHLDVYKRQIKDLIIRYTMNYLY